MWSNLSVFFLSFFYSLRNKMYFLIVMIKRNLCQCSSSSCVIFICIFRFLTYLEFILVYGVWYLLNIIFSKWSPSWSMIINLKLHLWVIVVLNILPLSYNKFIYVLRSISGLSILFLCSFNRKFEVNLSNFISATANIFSYLFLFRVFLPLLVCLLFHTDCIIYLSYTIKESVNNLTKIELSL